VTGNREAADLFHDLTGFFAVACFNSLAQQAAEQPNVLHQGLAGREAFRLHACFLQLKVQMRIPCANVSIK
jgi:hypothetical protein